MALNFVRSSSAHWSTCAIKPIPPALRPAKTMTSASSMLYARTSSCKTASTMCAPECHIPLASASSDRPMYTSPEQYPTVTMLARENGKSSPSSSAVTAWMPRSNTISSGNSSLDPLSVPERSEHSGAFVHSPPPCNITTHVLDVANSRALPDPPLESPARATLPRFADGYSSSTFRTRMGARLT